MFIEAHRSLLTGKKRAIAWGASNAAPFFIAQAPYRFSFLVDRKAIASPGLHYCDLPVLPPEVLRTIAPDDHVIVLFADEERYGEEIRREIATYGDFKVVGPLQPPDRYYDVFESPREGRAARLRSDRNLRRMLRAKRPTQPDGPPRQAIALFIGMLSTGGAERQIVLLALGLRQLGHPVHLFTIFPDAAGTEPWNQALLDAGVHRRRADTAEPSWWTKFRDARSDSHRLLKEYCQFTEFSHLYQLSFLVEGLQALQPQLLVSYLDDANITGGIAAIEAGVPRILMSGRNKEPNCFPTLSGFFLNKESLRFGYRALLERPGFVLSNNSQAGADSYADWLRLPADAITVIGNAVEAMPHATTTLLDELDLAPSARIILGVMRLSEEKDPLSFIEIFHALSRKQPGLIGILVGTGPMREEIRNRIDMLGLQDSLHLAGMRNDIFALLKLSRLLLLTSREEGLPNVLLEAQICGCPIVAADVGGVREALSTCWHNFVYPCTDLQAAVDKAHAILVDDEQAMRLAQHAQQSILGTRSALHLASATLAAAGL